ncbi:RNA polymerase sigma factor [Fodinibius sediminis]|uniref:RNA polymerase sigma factor, sigma-70 family n=1 Tax=Fodinibius sediminis TaxID=1214077 RepID=A0A521BH51_9BACT|nr:sigma-70 family RNA polymerase sigma factor [Fodinibius sediminis]SMO46467.1 RNA polymerase sigma factor, sigma-70 family [Fodinibius sediminis]
MDYSELVAALNEDDPKKINKLISALRSRLMAFLRIHMNASEDDAKDASQEALIRALESIKRDKLKNPDYVVSYILSICRNSYLKLKQQKQTTSLNELTDQHHQAPRQLQSLLNKEQMRLLQWCLDQLAEKHRQFIQYWFDHPDAHTQKVADRFNITVNNAWTRKHRVIKKLNDCYQKKINL